MSSLKLSWQLLCSVHFVFVSTLNLQRGRASVIGITNLSKQAVCVKAKAPADHVYRRRTWDEFKRVLSVAHASQHAEQAENLEYCNQLSGVCWGAIYCSSHTAHNWYRLFESMFLNHPVLCSCEGVQLIFIIDMTINISRQNVDLQCRYLSCWWKVEYINATQPKI